MSEETPTPPIRNVRGHYLKGHKSPGPGNPGIRVTSVMRDAYRRNLTAEEADEITKKIIAMAKSGDLDAAKEVSDRTGGKCTDSHTLDMIEALQAEIQELRRVIAEIATSRTTGRSEDAQGDAGASPAAAE